MNIFDDLKKCKEHTIISPEDKVEMAKRLTLFKKFFTRLPQFLQEVSIIEEKINKP